MTSLTQCAYTADSQALQSALSQQADTGDAYLRQY